MKKKCGQNFDWHPAVNYSLLILSKDHHKDVTSVVLGSEAEKRKGEKVSGASSGLCELANQSRPVGGGSYRDMS